LSEVQESKQPSPRKTRLSAGDRREQLLDVLVQVIRSEGYEQVTMARLAQAAGVNPSLLMHHFGSKENLMLTLVNVSLQRYGQLFRELPGSGDARLRLVQMLAVYFGLRWMNTLAAPEVFAIMSLARRHEEVRQAVARMYRRYHRVLTQELRFQQEQGCVRITDAAASAQVLMALTEGAHYFSDQLQPQISEAPGAYGLRMVEHALLLLGAGPLTQAERNELNDFTVTEMNGGSYAAE
jgi:AcrR family transcriptional regulator